MGGYADAIFGVRRKKTTNNCEFGMSVIPFSSAFQALTGNAPFPWQEAMYGFMVKGRFKELSSCNLPTGLGKTSVIAIWLIALANAPDKVPRRLVYVVDQRERLSMSQQTKGRSSDGGYVAKANYRLKTYLCWTHYAWRLSAYAPPNTNVLLRSVPFADSLRITENGGQTPRNLRSSWGRWT